MTLTTILLLIAIGLLVILAEIFLVPGSTVIGIVGVILLIIGVVGAFYSLGRTGGFVVFGVTLILISILGYLGFKSNTWQLFAVKSSINSKAPAEAIGFHIGDKGKTITRCAPIGKAEFENGRIEEVYSFGDFIEENTPVVIHKIQDKKIIVKPLT
ncbi:MAG: hypothetical protein N2167_07845 [Flavobacteriales bacterium]|nr:hypothetical protein [Flavobacteriales bacterium]